ncbi:YhjD/YihY/BrkB family envelope integrity protein [Cellulomonas sp. URHE0023]|uniref:YhjD/YihY/BrkB family envelope integrity protein n=1 Tax=Cellulomonas sp. URHE0023 TaxID=1380354 RepID=UPI000481DC38|nr:YhjD/YihY/BrkB family envelope integrity protein [Cellulomonas sp. URHE0023]
MSARYERWKLRTLRLVARWKIRGQRYWESLRGTPLGTLIDRVVSGFTAIEPFDRAMTLAAQAFVSIVPIMIVAAAVRPHKVGFGASMGDAIGLSDDVQQTLAGSLPSTATVASGVGLFGFLVAFFSATAYSRALERMFLKVWDVRKPPLRTAWRWIATIVAVMVAIALLSLTQAILGDGPFDNVVETAIRFVVWTVVWTYVPWVLMRTEISVRALTFTGAIISVALTVLAVFGSIYLPIVLTTGAEEFGVLGLVFAYISWLFVLSFAIVGATVVGRACAQDEGILGRLVRGPSAQDANVPNLSADAWRRWGGLGD